MNSSNLDTKHFEKAKAGPSSYEAAIMNLHDDPVDHAFGVRTVVPLVVIAIQLTLLIISFL